MLALSPAQTLLKGKAKVAAAIFSTGFGTAMCALLCVASYGYVMAMKPLGKILVYNVPVWVVQLILPIGFGLIALRLLWMGVDKWLGPIVGIPSGGGFRGRWGLVSGRARALGHPRAGAPWAGHAVGGSRVHGLRGSGGDSLLGVATNPSCPWH